MKTRNLLKLTKKRIRSYLKRRPHRSFRLSSKQDYKRSLNLPGYTAFTRYVIKTVWDHRKIFTLLVLLLAIITALLVGIGSQDTYTTLRTTLNVTGGSLFGGGFGEIGKAGLLLVTSATGGISGSLSDAQQIYAGLITLIGWLTTVWLLRNILAGHKVKLRDGIYSAGSPLVSTFVVALVFMVQLLPIGLAIIGYYAAAGSGLLNNGVEAMLFWAVAGLMSLLSLYWITSTFLALIIVTLPGMYPFKALGTAGDLVTGRRLRILYRFIWMAVIVVLAWAIVMLPVILLDSWMISTWSVTSWVPVVPIFLLGLSSITTVFVSSYVYLLYRKVVADDADSA